MCFKDVIFWHICLCLRPWSLQEGYTLDEGVVQAAVKACCRAGRPSEAEAILVKSLERGVVPEVGCFRAWQRLQQS